MSDVTGEVSLQHGAQGGVFAVVGGLSGDADLTNTRGGVYFHVRADLSGSASIERWLFGATSDYDMNIEGALQMKARTIYTVDCERGGHLAWRERFENTVFTGGLDTLLTAGFVSGDAAPTWFVGLIDGATPREFNSSDTMADHPGWAESDLYSDATRPAFTPGAVSGAAVDNSADRALFHVNGVGSVAGFFLVNDDTINATAGTVWGAGDFEGGARDVEDADILRVTAAVSLT